MTIFTTLRHTDYFRSIFTVAIVFHIALLSNLGFFGLPWGGSLYAQSDSSAIMNVESSDKGILIPRVSLTSATDMLTISSPATSLLVYNTATAGATPDEVIPGFYFWNGSKWVSLTGTTGGGSPLAFSDFYALMPPDNAATVASGGAVQFPQDGPTSGSILRTSVDAFNLPDIGTYQIDWIVSIDEAGQLGLMLNDVFLSQTVVGRSAGTTQIVGSRLIETTTLNSVLSVVNPADGATALTISNWAGGTNPVSASLVIRRVQ